MQMTVGMEKITISSVQNDGAQLIIERVPEPGQEPLPGYKKFLSLSRVEKLALATALRES